jgi:hypothetical protein
VVLSTDPGNGTLHRSSIFSKRQGVTKRVQNHLLDNSRAIHKLQDIMERTSNDVKMLVKHFEMVQTQID